MPQELSLKLQLYFREPRRDFEKIKACLEEGCTPERLAGFYFASGAQGPGAEYGFAAEMRHTLALVWHGVKLMDTSFGEKMRHWPEILPHELDTIRAVLDDIGPPLRARGLLDRAATKTWVQLHEDLDRRLPR